MGFTVEGFRSYFPAVADTAFFDNAGGTQTPVPVAQAISQALISGLSQRGRAYQAARNSDEIVTSARAAMGDLLGADPRGVVFGRSATALIFDFARTLTADLGPGDDVVVSRLDHDANIRPWVIAAERVGATIRWVDFDPVTADLTAADVEAVLTDRTRVVAVTAASNLYGSMPDIPAIAEIVKGRGATLVVDAVAYTPHELVDFTALGADFLVASPYKLFGPHLGVLVAAPETLERLWPDKLLPSPDQVPERFEHGTLPYELLAGVTAMVDLLASFGSQESSRRARLAQFYEASGTHERALADKAIAGLAELPNVSRVGDPSPRTPTVLFTVEGRTPVEVADFLGERGIAVSAGHFYAYEAALRSSIPDGGLRLSLAPYNTEDDVDRLLAALRELVTR